MSYSVYSSPRKWSGIAAALFAICFLLTGCESRVNEGLLLTSGAAITPTNEIEQIFYIGMFDPQSQIPPTIYRIRVNGQSSVLNGMRFGSGWVKAELVDSLSSSADLIARVENKTVVNKDGSKQTIRFKETKLGIDTQRKMIAFGPEGFRITPDDHRLVVVMGSSPEAFFEAVDNTMGEMAKIQNTGMSQELTRLLFESLKSVKSQQSGLGSIPTTHVKEAPAGGGTNE